MRLLVLLFLLALLLPAQINAQGLYGCAWISSTNICQGRNECDDGYTVIPSNIQNCNSFTNLADCNQRNFICVSENQSSPPPGNTTPPVNTAEEVQERCPENHISTAIGCINIENISLTSSFFLRWGLGIAGGVALLLISLAGYRIATSQGNPQRLQGGQELLLSAIGGLLMIVLSVYLLRFIGVDLLGIF